MSARRPDEKASLIQDAEGGYDVGDMIDRMGFGRFQIIMLFMCALCWLVSAISFESITWVLEDIEEDPSLQVDSTARGMLAMATPLGILIGSPFLGGLSDLYGRGKPILASMAVTAVVFVLQSLVKSWEAMFIFRVISGFAVGGLEMIPNNLFIETTPTEWRGRLRPLIHLAWHIGSLLCVGITEFVPAGDWKLLNMIYAVPVVLSFLITAHWFWVTESPHFLNVAGRNVEAEAALRRMAEYNGAEPPSGKMSVVVSPDDDEITFQQRLSELCNPNFFIVNIALGIMFMCLTGAYLMSFVFFAEYLHTTAHADYVHLIYVAGPVGRICGCIFTAFTIDILGRLPLLMYGGLFGGLSAFVLIYVDDIYLLFLAFFTMYFFLEITYCSLYTYAPELYPTTIRGLGIGLLAGIGDSGDVIFSYLGSVLLDQNPTLPIQMAGIMLIALGFVGFMLSLFHLETKGHGLSSTMDELMVDQGSLSARAHVSTLADND